MVKNDGLFVPDEKEAKIVERLRKIVHKYGLVQSIELLMCAANKECGYESDDPRIHNFSMQVKRDRQPLPGLGKTESIGWIKDAIKEVDIHFDEFVGQSYEFFDENIKVESKIIKSKRTVDL